MDERGVGRAHECALSVGDLAARGDDVVAGDLPQPGDELTATLTVASLRQIAGNDIIGTTSEITDASGALVCSTSATLVHRAES